MNNKPLSECTSEELKELAKLKYNEERIKAKERERLARVLRQKEVDGYPVTLNNILSKYFVDISEELKILCCEEIYKVLKEESKKSNYEGYNDEHSPEWPEWNNI